MVLGGTAEEAATVTKLRGGQYILDDKGEPVECPDLMKWAAWFEEDKRRFLARDDLPGGRWVKAVS